MSDYNLMRPQILDQYDLTYAVLTGYFYPTMLKLQYGLGSALAAAYNDYVAEHWFQGRSFYRQYPSLCKRHLNLCRREILTTANDDLFQSPGEEKRKR